MSLQFILDGYNILKHPLLTQLINKKIKDQRLALLEFIRIRRLTGSPKNRVTVVFDGYPDARETAGLDTIGAVDIIFSRRETADERIRKMVEDAGNPKNIVVVSDDKEIKFFVRAYGAKPLAIKDFIADKKRGFEREEDLWEAKLGFAEMHKINEELRQIWLKP